MLEMIFEPEEGLSSLLAYQDGAIAAHECVDVDGRSYVPLSPENNLLTHRVVLFASEATDYVSDIALLQEVRAFIHTYVDLEESFENVAAHYVLMTWRYDLFKELPYLRVLGNYGQGKSRFLLTVGSLCFKPIFASGASTVSPIFRLLDEIGGTLVIDEADFRASDERAEIVKILNNGHAEGFPILRSDVTPSKEFSPRAFRIFGPKIIATRHDFEDQALESRCLTATLGGRPLRGNIPITLPANFEQQALLLRNRLLMYRFRRFEGAKAVVELPPNVSPRLAQILTPLLAVAASNETRERLMAFALSRSESSYAHEDLERLVLASTEAVLAKGNGPVTVQAVAAEFVRRSQGLFGHPVAPRFIGSILRRLGVELHKSCGVYIVPVSARPRLDALFRRYGLQGEQGQ